MYVIKTDEQIKIMREAGRICALAHEAVEKALAPGISTLEISGIADKVIRENSAVPSFKNYNGYPHSICISINDEVIHGLPSKRKISDGDVVSIDIGACFRGYHGDAARTHLVGNSDSEAKRLLDVTKMAFFAGMDACLEGNRVRDISEAIFEIARINNIGVVRDYVGHGVGEQLHEDPEIPNFVDKMKGTRLYNGMTLAIEPMFNLGEASTYVDKDGWTVRTNDGKISCHYENTIVLTEDGPKILTKL
jgi:methionyl aminopeptidase